MNDVIHEGRVVHYVAYNERHLAGMIIGVNPSGTLDIVIFTNMQNINGDKNFGVQFHQDVSLSDNPAPGTCHLAINHK